MHGPLAHTAAPEPRTAGLVRQAIALDADGDATVRLRRFFAENARDRRIRWAVRAPVTIPSLGTEIALCRDVIVSVCEAADGAFAVDWLPADDGPFPRFTGMLRLAEDGGGTVRLVLEGEYREACEVNASPDRKLGHRIAAATARDVLERVAAGMHAARTRPAV